LLSRRNRARQPTEAAGLRFRGQERGIALLETLVALAILGIAAVAFIGGLGTASEATAVADKQATAESMARSQMEHVKSISYNGTAQYPTAPIPDGKDYATYSATIDAEPLHTPDDGIQKITVTIKRGGIEVMTLEGYKADR